MAKTKLKNSSKESSSPPTKEKKSSQKTGRSTKGNKRRGNAYECQIAKELRDLGYEGVVTARSESKKMDDWKIDLVDPTGELPFYPQIKRTIKFPDYFSIKEACPLKNKPFVLFWNKQVPTEKTFRSAGEVVILPKDYFYELINNK